MTPPQLQRSNARLGAFVTVQAIKLAPYKYSYLLTYFPEMPQNLPFPVHFRRNSFYLISSSIHTAQHNTVGGMPGELTLSCARPAADG